MCGPAALVPLTIAAAAVTAGAQVYSGMAARAQGRYEQNIAEQNREQSIRARDDTRQRGEMEQMRHFRRVSQQYGEQRARQAASGVDVSFGSAADLMADVNLIGYEDSAIIAQNTVREMRGYEVEGANYRMQGRAARSRGNAAFVGGLLAGTSTILGAASQIGGMRARAGTASIGG